MAATLRTAGPLWGTRVARRALCAAKDAAAAPDGGFQALPHAASPHPVAGRPQMPPRVTYTEAAREFKHEFVRQRMLEMPRIVAEWRERRRRDRSAAAKGPPY